MDVAGDLFGPSSEPIPMAPGAWLLRGFALDKANALLELIGQVTAQSPFRHQMTVGGYSMSAAMSSCGELGWVTDSQGYRYSPTDTVNGQPWPVMPGIFQQLATDAAAAAGYPHFDPQACLINRYIAGARMGLHQDRDEHDLNAPIVSISLGAPMHFQFGGPTRQSGYTRWLLEHGDVVVWGGPSRLYFHGVAPLKKTAAHPATGPVRYNLTFRRIYPAQG